MDPTIRGRHSGSDMIPILSCYGVLNNLSSTLDQLLSLAAIFQLVLFLLHKFGMCGDLHMRVSFLLMRNRSTL
jgi:hypothetical protein